MFGKAGSMIGFRLFSLNGEIGDVEEFIFDEFRWNVSHLVVTTGRWHSGHQVWIPACSLGRVNRGKQTIRVDLTSSQIMALLAMKSRDPLVCGTRSLQGIGVHATDGRIGRVEDFIINDETWSVCYLLMALRGWLPGRKVLIPLDQIKSVSAHDAKILLFPDRATVRLARPYREESADIEGFGAGLHGRQQGLGS